MATTTNPTRSTATASSTTKATTASKPSAKKTAAKRAKKTTARKTTAKKAAATKPAAKAAPRLLEREPKVVLEEAGYAMAGIAADAVEVVKRLPERFVSVRGEVTKTAEEAPERVKAMRTEAPGKVRSTVEELRSRASKDLETWLASFEKALDSKADEGRKVAEAVRSDARVKKVLAQTSSTRSQVKAAVTSVRRSAETVAEVAKETTPKED
jgi:hypothetical protein